MENRFDIYLVAMFSHMLVKGTVDGEDFFTRHKYNFNMTIFSEAGTGISGNLLDRTASEAAVIHRNFIEAGLKNTENKLTFVPIEGMVVSISPLNKNITAEELLENYNIDVNDEIPSEEEEEVAH